MTPVREEPIALVLGAGGARGLAQIGVIEAMEARGLHIATIAGSSSGALVGGFQAAGRLPELRDWLCGLTRTRMLRYIDPSLGGALVGGRRLMEALRELLGIVSIESLDVDLTIVAVDLMRQREVWLRRGDLLDAIRASIAIPGVFTPHRIAGRELVDGGVLAPLPITATRLSAAHRLVAVDMHGWPQLKPTDIPLPPSTALADEEAGTRGGEIGMVELIARAIDTMQAQVSRVQLALDPAELVIRIPRDACQFYEFWRAREMIEIGRGQAELALDAAGY
ncbi:patatin-like phospholipase family protein [Cognatilysobacter lacus]|uniref:Serine protease n=1 Tax=Cognatilysobacter lacus TaxID=1643323 RepID=A0A5D8Z202_9GAMM|nr:patatin-like phospholipase family protein [Lysobacter lacus]TZF88690.1 serine protease [Lysobacter lacus]